MVPWWARSAFGERRAYLRNTLGELRCACCLARNKTHLSRFHGSSRMFSMSANGGITQGATPGDRSASSQSENTAERPVEHGEILALFRLLTREPPPGHDFKTCPICKNYGVTEI